MTGLAQMIQNDWDEQKNGDIVEADSKKVNEILRGLYVFYPTDWQVGNHKKHLTKMTLTNWGLRMSSLNENLFKVLFYFTGKQGKGVLRKDESKLILQQCIACSKSRGETGSSSNASALQVS